jgi:hypothetical protein
MGGAMTVTLSHFCVYTIAHVDKLEMAVGKTKSKPFHEGHAWTTGRRLWLQAQAAGTPMPVVLADATDCSRLIYWGLLSDVVVDGTTTEYRVSGMRPIRPLHTPQDLILRSTGKPIASGFIRPYAICRTPTFLT